MSAVDLMYFVFRLWKPTFPISLFKVSGSTARIDSRLRPFAHELVGTFALREDHTLGKFSCKFRTAAAVTGSFVWLDNINDISVWNL